MWFPRLMGAGFLEESQIIAQNISCNILFQKLHQWFLIPCNNGRRPQGNSSKIADHVGRSMIKRTTTVVRDELHKGVKAMKRIGKDPLRRRIGTKGQRYHCCYVCLMRPRCNPYFLGFVHWPPHITIRKRPNYMRFWKAPVRVRAGRADGPEAKSAIGPKADVSRQESRCAGRCFAALSAGFDARYPRLDIRVCSGLQK